MPQSKPLVISQATRYQNAALNYYLGLTDSPYLHYGYWEPLPTPEDLTIANLRKAQAAYSAKLLGFMPAGIKTILDVGCGIGGNAAYLLDRGFEVEGLAPDPFQQAKFLSLTQNKAIFHLSQFETFTPSHAYDLVLLSESSQYMAAINIAQCAAAALNPGGYLLLADMMRSDGQYTEGIFSNCQIVTDLHAALKQAGFRLVKDEDITAQTAPTIDLYIEVFQRYGLSTLRYLADLVAIAVPPLHALIRWAYRRWLKKLVVEGLEAGKIFEKHLCYQIQLWQLEKTE
jgi:MPBQ/MSBQ methyltransferase